jgi:hypothetical protein
VATRKLFCVIPVTEYFQNVQQGKKFFPPQAAEEDLLNLLILQNLQNILNLLNKTPIIY